MGCRAARARCASDLGPERRIIGRWRRARHGILSAGDLGPEPQIAGRWFTAPRAPSAGDLAFWPQITGRWVTAAIAPCCLAEHNLPAQTARISSRWLLTDLPANIASGDHVAQIAGKRRLPVMQRSGPRFPADGVDQIWRSAAVDAHVARYMRLRHHAMARRAVCCWRQCC